MMIRIALLAIISFVAGEPYAQQGDTGKAFKLIAHRGGIVDSVTPENSLASLQKAHQQGFWMVEIDLRVTRDGKLITNHDAHLKRYFNTDRQVNDMTWKEITALKGPHGHRVMTLEEVLQFCSGKMQVMIDNKIRGNDTVLFHQLLNMLKKYRLDKEALMIGTDESTEFFTGKIKLSCTRQQLEENIRRPDFNPDSYYLFGSNITREDVAWANERKILAVGVVNSWTFRGNDKTAQAAKAAAAVRSTGATHFQIDSEYLQLFR